MKLFISPYSVRRWLVLKITGCNDARQVSPRVGEVRLRLSLPLVRSMQHVSPPLAGVPPQILSFICKHSPRVSTNVSPPVRNSSPQSAWTPSTRLLQSDTLVITFYHLHCSNDLSPTATIFSKLLSIIYPIAKVIRLKVV